MILGVPGLSFSISFDFGDVRACCFTTGNQSLGLKVYASGDTLAANCASNNVNVSRVSAKEETHKGRR